MSVEWNGEGVPPIGSVCEIFDCEKWIPVKLKYAGEYLVVVRELSGSLSERVFHIAKHPDKFRPIRTEEVLKLDEVAVALTFVLTSLPGDKHVTEWSYAIVESIAAGKIPHITLK